MNRVILLLLVTCLFGCSKPLDIQLEPEVHIFLSKDTKQGIPITLNDKAYLVLNEWLHENKTGWYATSGRYPGGVYIKSGKFGIQVIESKVVIYSTVGNEPKAIYIQEIEKGELSAILAFGK
ncbi:hypothetical protein ESZ36_10520 [Colwellia demingiae]|uniref:Uncharacterized protein n=1 Tax=Colwellia demingiae TaxID=89401 RepID=A0A5C6QFF7_9GAMM|nr:hypothetical protein [Colwellia demingiae]TWX67746.1 hypothetical protein ESZ36_10520 [Colwellia demingiae]